MTVAMYFFGLLVLISAGGVVFAKKPLNSALCLVATLFLVAAHYAMMGADFVAALQVLIYAGAIMVLVIFVIMLLGVEKDDGRESFPYACIVSVFIGCFIALLVVGIRTGVDFTKHFAGKIDSSAKAVGASMFGNYLYAFEVVSLLLLTAIIGAVVLAHDKKRALPEGRGLEAVRDKEIEV